MKNVTNQQAVSHPPKTIIKEFFIPTERGISPLVSGAPAGYLIKEIKRKKDKAIVTYELISTEITDTKTLTQTNI